jgi:dipeptidase E
VSGTRRIFAMGGGGFAMEPDNAALDDFILSLAPAREPRILFMPTASGDPTGQITAFHARFGDRACRAEHLSLFRLHGDRRPLEDVILAQDVLYIGGGSMRNLLAIWHAHGLDRILELAWHRGVVLAGLSAGAMCWFEGGVTRSGGPPETSAGLALLFEDEQLVRVVSSRPGAGAQRCDAVAGELVRRRITPELLGGHGPGAPEASDAIREMRAVQRLRDEFGPSL